MRHLIMVALCLVLIATSISAQNASKTDPPVEMKQLQLFIGDWEGPGSYENAGNKMAFTMSVGGTNIIDGMAVELNPTAELKNVGTYKEKTLVAWDSMLKQVTMFTVSNMGEVGQYNGHWVEGKTNTLALKGTKTVGNDTYKMDATIFFHDGDKFTWRVTSTKNGQADGTFEATLTKQ